jgi:hypothetical protein
LLYFYGVPGDGYVSVQWGTASELQIFGFYVYRSTSSGDLGTKVWDELEPGRGEAGGATYVLTDTNVVNGTPYWYTLEVLNRDSTSDFHPADPDHSPVTPGVPPTPTTEPPPPPLQEATDAPTPTPGGSTPLPSPTGGGGVQPTATRIATQTAQPGATSTVSSPLSTASPTRSTALPGPTVPAPPLPTIPGSTGSGSGGSAGGTGYPGAQNPPLPTTASGGGGAANPFFSPLPTPASGDSGLPAAPAPTGMAGAVARPGSTQPPLALNADVRSGGSGKANEAVPAANANSADNGSNVGLLFVGAGLLGLLILGGAGFALARWWRTGTPQ